MNRVDGDTNCTKWWLPQLARSEGGNNHVQEITKTARRMHMLIMEMLAVIEGWLLGGAFGPGADPLLLVAGTILATGGRGGSTTSLSVNTGLGASAGGKY